MSRRSNAFFPHRNGLQTTTHTIREGQRDRRRICKKNIHQRSSRAINMRFYWVRYRVIQGNFLFCWVAVEQNPADYFTNHHPTNHNCSKQSTHILPTADASKYSLYMAPNDLTGCVEYLPAWKTDDERTKYPPFKVKKWTTDGRRQTDQLDFHNICGDNIVRMAH